MINPNKNRDPISNGVKKPIVAAIAAIGKNRVLGKDNKLIWHIPDDLKRFKELTTEHPIILGRKTFESILGYLGRPLPNRTSIVVTRQFDQLMASDPNYSREEVIVATSIEDAIEKGKSIDDEIIFIGGGAQIYESALPFTNRLYLTIVDSDEEGDSFFPEYEKDFVETKSVKRKWNDISYRWVDLERK